MRDCDRKAVLVSTCGLWKAIHSKQSLLALVKQGNEEYARRRIERMRELVAAAAAEEASA